MSPQVRLPCLPWIVVILFLSFFAAECTLTKIIVDSGEPLSLELPAFKTCGQYFLLDPSLELVLILTGTNSSNIFGDYIKRTRVRYSTSGGVTLNFDSTTPDDQGVYKVATSTKESCQNISFHVTITGREQLEVWSQWSECVLDCDPDSSRSRIRRCSVPGGCVGFGPLTEEETCDQADHCPHWTSWSQYGDCSAKCGKGFRIRRRICLAGNATLLENSACPGHATEGRLCMVVCEVVTAWSNWSEWATCSKTCGSGIRTRNRKCGEDPRATSADCPGNSTESAECSNNPCEALTTTSPKPFPTTPAIIKLARTPQPVSTTDQYPLTSTPTIMVTPTLPSNPLPAVVVVTDNNSLVLYALLGLGIIVMLMFGLLVLCIRQRHVRRRQSSIAAADIKTIAQKLKETRHHKVDDAPRRPSESSNVYSEMDKNKPIVARPPNIDDVTGSGSRMKFPTNSALMHMIEDELLNQSFSSGYVDSDFDDTDDCPRESREGGTVKNLEEEDVQYFIPPAENGRDTNSDEETVKANADTSGEPYKEEEADEEANANQARKIPCDDTSSDIYSYPPEEEDDNDTIGGPVSNSISSTNTPQQGSSQANLSFGSPIRTPKLSYLEREMRLFHDTLAEMEESGPGSRDSVYANVEMKSEGMQQELDNVMDEVFNDDHIYSNN